MNNPAIDIQLRLCGHPGYALADYPVKIGVPFPRSFLHETSFLCLRTSEGKRISADFDEILRWNDGSLRWVLLRFVSSGEEGMHPYHIGICGLKEDPPKSKITISENIENYVIMTGRAKFTMSRQWLRPLAQVEVAGRNLLNSHSPGAFTVLLRNIKGKEFGFRVERSQFEHCGCSSATLLQQGSFIDRRERILCRGECRLSFWSGTGLVCIETTLWNPKAARHRGGIWDLGDPGSIYFRSLHIPFGISPDTSIDLKLSPYAGAEAITSKGEALSIHQSSSGSPNWQSLAQVDKNNIPTPKFRGYRQNHGGEITAGFRASPVVLYKNSICCAAFALENFWEKFPSRMEIRDGLVSIETFPAADNQDYELQGGEKSTFRIWANFNCSELNYEEMPGRLKLAPTLDPQWYQRTAYISGSLEKSEHQEPFWSKLIGSGIEGPNSFFEKREKFDEYGWRNFGDTPADHEAQHYRGTRALVSHYNNQYDLLFGFLCQFMATGERRWFELARDLAEHVLDHDLYHTQEDKAAYNGGYFWHTVHYLHAGKSTHRAYSRHATDDSRVPPNFGGGPSNEHNYSTGLAMYFLLTGNPRARAAVLQLGTWVRDMQDPWKTPFRFLSRNPTGLATCTRELDFQGPGRGGAYSINACIDAFLLTGESGWMASAEELIKTCIHPRLNPDNLLLLNREDRWSYVVFLHILGRYLDVKRESGEEDMNFHYGRASLLAFARWMIGNEYAYLDRPEELEFPTSTWAAQELRKTSVFVQAARYGLPAEEAGFIEKARYFERRARESLEISNDHSVTRILALILATKPLCDALQLHEHFMLGAKDTALDFGEPQSFVPQKIDALKRVRRVVRTLGLGAVTELARYLKDRRLRAERPGGGEIR
jgi:hypothetical protein